jgi:hypothetical protein
MKLFSRLSPLFITILVPFVSQILLAFALVLFFSTAPAFAADVTLAWNPNTEEDLFGYRIYYGTASGDYDYTLEVGNQTEYTVTGLEEGLLYYFAATAYDLSWNESGYSDEVVYAPPVVIRSRRPVRLLTTRVAMA